MIPAAWKERYRFVLASGSPRRQELLQRLGLEFEVQPSTFPETLDKTQFPSAEAYVRENAYQKAREVHARLSEQRGSTVADHRELVVLGADTIVVSQDGRRILEKPSRSEHAFTMLSQLCQQQKHQVMTAVVVFSSSTDSQEAQLREQPLISFVESTTVYFGGEAELSERLLRQYVATGEPMDKAGGYGYQAMASVLVERIEGCYYNVVGLPVYRLYHRLLGSLQ